MRVRDLPLTSCFRSFIETFTHLGGGRVDERWPRRALWDEPLNEQVNPRRAEEALFAVCQAGMILRRETFDHETQSVEAAVVHHRAKFKAIAERAAAYPPPTKAQANAELARALCEAMDRGWLSDEVFVDAERRVQAGRLVDMDAVAQLIAEAKAVPLAEVRRRIGLDAG
jgi:hypothetical protein